MRFRPCIDIHNGKVKQLVGGSLKDENNAAKENFVSGKSASFYAELYRRDGLKGGHIILLNPPGTEYYEADRAQAREALQAFPGGMQIGGGINAENAPLFLQEGASHVIVTSYVFRDGQIHWENLERLAASAGRERIVLDVSCRRREDGYYIVTDRWQKYTKVRLDEEVLRRLQEYCGEFLVHGVDVEGKAAGADEELVRILAKADGVPITYAGGIGSLEELERFRQISGGRLDVTVGSALDLFGGKVPYEIVKNIK